MRAVVALALVCLLALPVTHAQDATAAKDPRNFTWVEEGVLAVGGGGLTEADVETLAALGFAAIADFRAEHQDPKAAIEARGMAFFDMPIDSASDISEAQLATFVEWARAQKAAGRPMYIHCTNGWHRAAAFAVAYEIAAHGEGYDEAAREAAARRAGTVMRAPAGLLDYAARVSGAPQLAVALVSTLSHPGLGGTMPVHVDVWAGGAPVAGAAVRVWSEESKIRIEGVTDANGRFTIDYVAPAQAFMDHLYARASMPGYADGADNVEFIFGQAAKARGTLDVVAERTSEGLRVSATSAGRPVPIRAIANAPGYSEYEAGASGVVLIPDAPSSGIAVRVVSWGSEGGSATVAGEPAAPRAEPEPLRRGEIAAERVNAVAHTLPPAPPSTAPAKTADAVEQQALALRYAILAVSGAALVACYLVASRSRSGVGSR